MIILAFKIATRSDEDLSAAAKLRKQATQTEHDEIGAFATYRARRLGHTHCVVKSARAYSPSRSGTRSLQPATSFAKLGGLELSEPPTPLL